MSKDTWEAFDFGFQSSFEHDFGDLDSDEACRRVQLMGLG